METLHALLATVDDLERSSEEARNALPVVVAARAAALKELAVAAKATREAKLTEATERARLAALAADLLRCRAQLEATETPEHEEEEEDADAKAFEGQLRAAHASLRAAEAAAEADGAACRAFAEAANRRSAPVRCSWRSRVDPATDAPWWPWRSQAEEEAAALRRVLAELDAQLSAVRGPAEEAESVAALDAAESNAVRPSVVFPPKSS